MTYNLQQNKKILNNLIFLYKTTTNVQNYSSFPEDFSTKYGISKHFPYFVEILPSKKYIYGMTQKNVLSDQKLVFSSDDLQKQGFSYYQITKMVEQGKLIRLNKSYYENAGFTGDMNDFYYVQAFAPQGVICLLSAAVYYGLTTFRPDAIDVAIPPKTKLSTQPESQRFSLHYFSGERHSLGVRTISENKNPFKIYDIEKTVVDIISNRNKVGIEETKEILTNYLARQDRNINKLYRYAGKLSCLKILKTYLEVLV